MDEKFNIVDQYCFSLFPEMLNHFSEVELRSASNLGSYIFHEDFFLKFLALSATSDGLMARIGRYVEYLAGDENNYLGDLAEIGILEGAVSQNLYALARHLGPKSKTLLKNVLSHFDVDHSKWA